MSNASPLTPQKFRRWLGGGVLLLLGGLAVAAASVSAKDSRPNIVFVLVDDMGFGDPSSYGNGKLATPRIDQLAHEGTRFTQFYVAAPICSASRTGFLTGQYPTRHRITSFLASRRENLVRDMADYLSPDGPTLPRALKAAGYETAHFGKWHLGGGRDVDDAPHPSAYGFDRSVVCFEGLGDRILIPGDKLSLASEKLGQGKIRWAEKSELAAAFVDEAIGFLDEVEGPFFLQLWFNDPHAPWLPAGGAADAFFDVSENPDERDYFAVIANLDTQIGRLIDFLDTKGFRENTVVIFASDNGPTSLPRYEVNGFTSPGFTAGFRGRKDCLYDGGTREPFIVRWPGQVAAGRVDETSVLFALDLFPTLCEIANLVPPPGLDGESMSAAWAGQPWTRTKPLCWDFGRKRGPEQVTGRRGFVASPTLAIRQGDWKFLMNGDGSSPELYHLKADWQEVENLVNSRPDKAARLRERLKQWLADVTGDAS